MKISKPKLLLALGLATALTACVENTPSYYTQTHYTNPTYTIVQTTGNIEIRDYKSLLVAEITEKGDRKTAMKNGYEALNDYFHGDNSTGEAIAMTEPMAQYPVFRSIHGATSMPSVDNHEWVIRFYLPVEFTSATVPQPKNTDIRLLNTNAMTVAVINYSGPWSDDNIQTNENMLTSYVSNNGLHSVDVPIYAFYDQPETAPWGRHNEIMVRLADN
jgi:DNA gyrase inhibitor GyrI